MRREDLFTVVLEQFQNDTADHADILLPATTFLEHTDLYFAYGHYHLQLARPRSPAPGETRSNVEVFRALAERMGFDDACFRDSEDDMIRTLLDSGHPFVQGITLERLDREHSVRLSRAGRRAVPAVRRGRIRHAVRQMRVRRGNARLPAAGRIAARRPDLRARYPLELISPKNDDSMNSTFGNESPADGQTSTVFLHDEDARARRSKTATGARV